MTLAEVAPAEGVRVRRVRWGALGRGRGLVGVVLVSAVVLAGVIGPWWAPFDPTEQIRGANLAPPGSVHWLGTDEVNRDIFSRVLHGIRIDLVVVFLAVPLGALLGVALGLVSTLHAVADVVTQRVLDVLLAFPVLILAITATAALGPGLRTIAVVIVLAELPVFGRLARTSVLKVRALPYVESARVMGASEAWLLRHHVLPNSLEPLTVQLAVSMSVAVFIEGAMSFLGLGVRPPDPSLGSLIKDGIRNVWDAPFFVVGPLVVVSMLVLGFLLVAQAVSAQRRS